MKNILHVVNTSFVIPYFLGNQLLYFKEKGYKEYIICSPSKNLERLSNKYEFEYKEIKVSRKISIIKDLNAVFKTVRFIYQKKIDIVTGHTPKGALIAMLAAYIMHVPIRIYFRHGLVYETMNGNKRKLMIFVDRLTAYCATKIVCVSPSLAKKSLEDNLNSEKKQIVLGNGTCGGIDAINKFNPKNIDQAKLARLKNSLKINKDDFLLGFCGRLVRDKGISELVESFIEIQKLSKTKVKLLLVGDFEVRDSLSYSIKKTIRNNQDIILTGFIYKDIEYYYAMMDIFILPSYREGFGMCVLEASAMEIPILTTKATGCIDSIIENQTGYYIENSSKSISSTIVKCLNSDDINKIGKNGRKFVLENFDQHLIWKEIEKLYL